MVQALLLEYLLQRNSLLDPFMFTLHIENDLFLWGLDANPDMILFLHGDCVCALIIGKVLCIPGAHAAGGPQVASLLHIFMVRRMSWL